MTATINTVAELFSTYPQANFVIHSLLTKRPKKRKRFSADISYLVQVDYQLADKAKSFRFDIDDMDLAYGHKDFTIENMIVEAILFQIRKGTSLNLDQEELILPTGQQQSSHQAI